MIQHLLLLFAAPTLIVAWAPWQPLLDGLPGRTGHTATAGIHARRLVTAELETRGDPALLALRRAIERGHRQGRVGQAHPPPATVQATLCSLRRA
jgi:cytochrome c oxidase assembly factor CtaG